MLSIYVPLYISNVFLIIFSRHCHNSSHITIHDIYTLIGNYNSGGDNIDVNDKSLSWTYTVTK